MKTVFFQSRNFWIFPSVRGSVILPVSAEAVAVSGLQRKTAVVLLSPSGGKFLGVVRRLCRRGRRLAHAVAAVQPAWWMRAPA